MTRAGIQSGSRKRKLLSGSTSASGEIKGNQLRGSLTVSMVCGTAVLLASLVLALSVGAVAVPVGTVWDILITNLITGVPDPDWARGHEAIVWEIRFPRSILACLVGAGLAVVGTSLQAVTRNPLADPHLLGISSGGALGAVIALLHVGLILGPVTVPLLAFAGALGATLIVLAVSKFTDASTASRLVLAGVAVSFILMAVANVFIFLGDSRATHTVVFWMLGGLGLAEWQNLVYPTIALAGCTLYIWLNSGKLNAITIGDESASTLGIRVFRFRLIVFVVGAMLTGVMVAYSGIIGFVGLMVPHTVRMLVGGNHYRVIPLAALVGGLFLLWADIVARTLLAPEDLPIGIVTGLVGGSFFVWLLRGRRA